MTYEFDTHQSTNKINWADFDLLWENYYTVRAIPRGNLKKKALSYIDEHEYKNGWSKHTQRKLVVKSKKIRKSSKKADRMFDSQLTDMVNWYIHFYQ